jgi:hypothetical protein
MATVGLVALILVGIVILTGLYLGVRSIPDIRRYRRIRRM